MGDFQSAARRFCTVVEDAGAMTPSALIGRSWHALAAVYAEATALPSMDPDDNDARAAALSLDALEELHRPVEAALTRCTKDTPLFEWREDSAGVIADDLTSVYDDLSRGLSLLQHGSSPADALAWWRESFENHWGPRALHALGVLHRIGSSA